MNVSFSTEIWSLVCAIFAVMGSRHLFDSWFPTKDRILEEQVDALGPLPEERCASWSHLQKCFDKNLQRVDESPRCLLEDRLESDIRSRDDSRNARDKCERCQA